MIGGFAWARLRRNRSAVAALTVLALLALAAAAAPLLAPRSPIDIAPDLALRGPSAAHWMGTDQFGRDVFARVLHGGSASLRMTLGAVALALVAGVPLGLVAGYYRGWLDAVVTRAADVLLAIPSVLLAMLIVAVLEPGLASVALAVGVAAVPQFVRVTRGATLAASASAYAEAARVTGSSDLRILTRHILPNLAGPLVVLATVAAATALLTGAALSFLGLGPRPPEPEWGAMLSASRDYLRQAPWQAVFPGLAITITALAVNLLGDGLRDALDPRA